MAGDPDGKSGSRDGDVNVAQFNCPWGIAISGSGALFVADTRNHRIRLIRDGVVTTIAGCGPTGAYREGDTTTAKFNEPVDIAFDDVSGALYVADAGNHRIRSIPFTDEPTVGEKSIEAKLHGDLDRKAPPSAPRVFLCHSGSQKSLVFRLYLLLESLGYPCFFDRASLFDTNRFDHDIERALDAVEVGVVVISHDFFDKKWCTHEAERLLRRSRDNVRNPCLVYPVFLDSKACASGGELGAELSRLSGNVMRSRDDLGDAAVLSAGCDFVVGHLSGRSLPAGSLARVLAEISSEALKWNSINATPLRLAEAVSALRARVSELLR